MKAAGEPDGSLLALLAHEQVDHRSAEEGRIA
jgi:hypothetical protein